MIKMNPKLNIISQIDINDLEYAIRDLSEKAKNLEFNKFAVNVLEVFLRRSYNIGISKDLINKITKTIQEFEKEYHG